MGGVLGAGGGGCCLTSSTMRYLILITLSATRKPAKSPAEYEAQYDVSSRSVSRIDMPASDRAKLPRKLPKARSPPMSRKYHSTSSCVEEAQAAGGGGG